jgi:hypothetical protein
MTKQIVGRLAAAAAFTGVATFASSALAQPPPAPMPPAPGAPTHPTTPNTMPTMQPIVTPTPSPTPTPGMPSTAPAMPQTNPAMPGTTTNATTPVRPRNMLTHNPNGYDWLAKFDRPNVIAKNRHAYVHSTVGRGRPPRG